MGAFAAVGGGGTVGRDGDGAAVGPVAEQHAMDVQPLALSEQGSYAGAVVAVGGLGDQHDRREGLFVGVGAAQVGDGVDLVLTGQTGAMHRLRFADVQGLVDVGGDGEPGCAGQGEGSGAEQSRHGHLWDDHFGTRLGDGRRRRSRGRR
ncbi:hypothetical protein [Micromonospora sp. 4G55]|uniref:hypothetical protein n=1 Tax=Micromonospora sp. 4G55 TaxID=2806102 RepID=UPI001A53B431|nr:hypothetical protein [Micromonospora sp. 4G55]MBM0256011.1 hypothetical protein [Micromonospora sp. 4G55]